MHPNPNRTNQSTDAVLRRLKQGNCESEARIYSKTLFQKAKTNKKNKRKDIQLRI
jgi:hypothetical protein